MATKNKIDLTTKGRERTRTNQDAALRARLIEGEYITKRDTLAMLEISASSLARMVKRGELAKFVQVHKRGKPVYYKYADVIALRDTVEAIIPAKVIE